MQAANRLAAQASRRAIRPESGAMQRFIGIDVPDARNGRLVEQHRLDRRAAAAKTFEQRFGVEAGIDGLRSELRQRTRDEQLVLSAEEQSAEPARIPIAELKSIVEVEDRVRVVRDLGGGVDE